MADPRQASVIREKKAEVEAAGRPLHLSHGDDLNMTESKRQTVLDAKKASDEEQKMTLLQGVRLYPKAIAWSVLISTCIAMEGYQLALVNNFYGFAPFNEKYGEPTGDPETPYQVGGETFGQVDWMLMFVRRCRRRGKLGFRMVLLWASSLVSLSMDVRIYPRTDS